MNPSTYQTYQLQVDYEIAHIQVLIYVFFSPITHTLTLLSSLSKVFNSLFDHQITRLLISRGKYLQLVHLKWQFNFCNPCASYQDVSRYYLTTFRVSYLPGSDSNYIQPEDISDLDEYASFGICIALFSSPFSISHSTTTDQRPKKKEVKMNLKTRTNDSEYQTELLDL